MNTCTDPEWFTTTAGRTVYCQPSEVAAENAKEATVDARLRAAPSFPALLKTYNSFKRSLHGAACVPAVIEGKPWEMLTAHAGVMNAKSTRAVTLRNLATAVFRETGLPRQERGTFRGSDGLDWDCV